MNLSFRDNLCFESKLSAKEKKFKTWTQKNSQQVEVTDRKLSHFDDLHDLINGERAEEWRGKPKKVTIESFSRLRVHN